MLIRDKNQRCMQVVFYSKVKRGYNAHKKIGGRKRHIVVDTNGRLLAMHLTPADIADSTVAQFVPDALVKRWPWVQHLFGDAAYVLFSGDRIRTRPVG